MDMNSRRNFLGKLAAAALATGAAETLSAQTPGGTAPAQAAMKAGGEGPRRPSGQNHVHDGVYYFSGTGSNDGYGREDHVKVTDAFEKHVTRTMDALKRSMEHAGCTMDSIIHLDVFLCLPLDDSIPTPAGTKRFEAHKAQYDALNKIYRTYFSPGQAPSRACMALEWIPGDSLIEIAGVALVVNAPSTEEEK